MKCRYSRGEALDFSGASGFMLVLCYFMSTSYCIRHILLALPRDTRLVMLKNVQTPGSWREAYLISAALEPLHLGRIIGITEIT